MSTIYAIVPAAGRGVRMGKDRPKQFLEVSSKPILLHTLQALSKADFLSGIILAVPRDYMSEAERLAEECVLPSKGDFRIRVVAGGAERQDSVYNALMALPEDCEWVLIHDGVRPMVTSELLEKTLAAARKTGAAIAAVPATDTVKRVSQGRVVETLSRDSIWMVQTPQGFRKRDLLAAYEEARKRGWSATDDAGLMERLGAPVEVIEGDRFNIKVTTPEDLRIAELFLNERP